MLPDSLPPARLFSFLLTIFIFCASLVGMDKVVILRDGVSTELEGEIVVEAQDGGLMFRGTDGRIWMIQPKEIKTRLTNDSPFAGLSTKDIGQQLISRLPKSSTPYRVMQTNGYSIVYNTTPAFANWVKGVYLRLNVGFRNFWKNNGIEINKPDVPLCVVIFRTKEEFDAYSISTLGGVQGNALAYYNMQTNQVVMYDLTNSSSIRGGTGGSTSKINALLQQPQAANMVATIVHEAVHQISFNSGLQTRFGPCPFWLNEGLAMFFEVPDLRSRRGWNGIGKVNQVRLVQLKKMLAADTTGFFDAVIGSDDRFRKPDEILDAYAEAWALNYYLIKRKPKQFVAYLKELSNLPPLTEVEETERVTFFEKHFGPLGQVKKECFNFVLK